MTTSGTSLGTDLPYHQPEAKMDRDYNYYINKYNAQPPPPPPNPPRNSKYQSNLGVMPMEPVMEQMPMGGPTRSSSGDAKDDGDEVVDGEDAEDNVDGDEALMDLAQLEELHHEAERMKALGNKHMAAQEYSRAYNAYSAALQLSPVGPSSHVFLSNRSAALLSLKRYSAAATDARRAIVLAPTFGKAHARLGQALYFLKDYEGAVNAYEDAIHYEPDDPITKTYLEKAKTKWDRQKEKQAKTARGEEISVLTENSSIQATVINSVATDPNAQAAVVQTMGFRGQSNIMAKAINLSQNASIADTLQTNEEDPDFEEALRIQERANRFLANKNYKFAIEEYTAALFLVPDDYNLSPDLHLGRAHALNGSRRHESAKIDALLAIKIKPTPEAYSTLAKSLFYMKDYQGSIDAFGQCKNMLPEGESLSLFDRAYLQKAELALKEALSSGSPASPSRSFMSNSTPIPKLKPPRFVPREEALNRTPNIPSMPKSWPQQSPRDTQVLQCGPEREILFLSEALGIKLNRGPDGVVRVIDVSPEIPGSPIARQGKINVGDVIREAAGVDLRRPITNIMWGDTVALIKMAPRPIVLVVASELNPSPAVVLEQRKAAAAKALSPNSAAEYFPSNSSGDESVKRLIEQNTMTRETDEEEQGRPLPSLLDESLDQSQGSDGNVDTTVSQVIAHAADMKETVADHQDEQGKDPEAVSVENAPTNTESSLDPMPDDPNQAEEEHIESKNDVMPDKVQKEEGGLVVSSLRDEESEKLGGAEIFFPRSNDPKYCGWDNLRWMSFSGSRKLTYFERVSRFEAGRRSFFWSGDHYVDRMLAIYEVPNLILVLRPPENDVELREILDLPEGAQIQNVQSARNSVLVVDSVVEPKTCKLKLSPLTTITSFLPDVPEGDLRRRSCFELINPSEPIILSSVRLRQGAERPLTSFTDSGAFLETSRTEHALKTSIFQAHTDEQESHQAHDISWTHQMILGTLHAYVVLGNQVNLEKALSAAKEASKKGKASESDLLDPRIIDAVDEAGRTALHYACFGRFSSAVQSLVRAGANVDLRVEPDNLTPCHICALNLDSKSLEAILGVNRRPNVLDSFGRTPVYLAIMNGLSVGGMTNPSALAQCLAVLESFGVEVQAPMGFQDPISALASDWRHEELEVVLLRVNYRYPVMVADSNEKRKLGISVSALFQYPIHSCLLALRERVQSTYNESSDAEWRSIANGVYSTVKVLLNYGFEPNERLEAVLDTFEGSHRLTAHVGFAPLQMLAAAVLDASDLKDRMGHNNYMEFINLASSLAELLVKHGARLSLDPPPPSRSKERNFEVPLPTNVVAGNEIQVVDRSQLKLDSNKTVMELLGASRLSAAERTWRNKEPVQSLGKCAFHTDKLPIEDSAAPGGSDVKSCAVCWIAFGTLRNRKHRCRISRRHMCDECSSKRILVHDEEHRVSDGQFNLMKWDTLQATTEEQQKRQQAGEEFSRLVQKQTTRTSSASARLDRLEAEEKANRESLFGNVVESMTKAVFGGEDGGGEDMSSYSQADNSVQGLSNQLNQTRDVLNQRGEKLSTLADKSDKLVNASKDFASMAKELNKQSGGGLFW